MVLPILACHYCVRVVDPYHNQGFRALLAQSGLFIESLSGSSLQPYLSVNRGVRKLFDLAASCPAYFTIAQRFRQFVLDEHIDLVYVSQTKSVLFSAIAIPCHIPIIYHCHGTAATGIGLVIRLQSRIAHVIANSPFTGEKLLGLGLSPCRMTVVTNAVSFDQILHKARSPSASSLPRTEMPPVILLPHAAIDAQKGTLLAIEALTQLAQAGLPGELWITGDSLPGGEGYTRQVKTIVVERGLRERIHFLGMRADVYSVMSRADIIIVPSLIAESFGLAAVEAMVLGKTVVVSNRGALPSLVQDGITGRVFDPKSPGALGQVLIDLVTDIDRRRQYGRAAREYACSRFSLERYEKEFVGVFDRVLSSSM